MRAARSKLKSADEPIAALLVIGYGNELRADDGLGPRLARAIEVLNYKGVQVIVQQQLTPELAEPIHHADGVIFLDAAVNCSGNEVRLERVDVLEQSGGPTHFSSPGRLLDLTASIFGESPPAWCMPLPAFDLSFGESLSPPGEAIVPVALRQFDKFWRKFANGAMD